MSIDKDLAALERQALADPHGDAAKRLHDVLKRAGRAEDWPFIRWGEKKTIHLSRMLGEPRTACGKDPREVHGNAFEEFEDRPRALECRACRGASSHSFLTGKLISDPTFNRVAAPMRLRYGVMKVEAPEWAEKTGYAKRVSFWKRCSIGDFRDADWTVVDAGLLNDEQSLQLAERMRRGGDDAKNKQGHRDGVQCPGTDRPE